MEKIADSHTHIYPDNIAPKALHQIATFYHLESRIQEDPSYGTAECLLRCQSEAGIGVSLVCEAAHKPSLVETLNSFIAEKCALYPERFIGLAAIHPDCENIPDILDRAREHGLRGVKIHPDYQAFNMDDGRCDVLYQYCEEKRFPILIHCGDNRYDYSAPFRLQRVVDRFPQAPIIAAHLGGYQRWKESFLLKNTGNLYFDTSSSLFFLKREEVLAFFEKFGYDRFFFGSDYPLFDPKEELERFF